MANPFNIPMLGLSLKNLFSRPATRRYPEECRAPFEGTRGQVAVELAGCVYCGLCAKRCPSQAIAVSREKKSFVIEHFKCIACGACVDACNKHSLTMEVSAPAVATAEEAGPLGTHPRGREERIGGPVVPATSTAA